MHRELLLARKQPPTPEHCFFVSGWLGQLAIGLLQSSPSYPASHAQVNVRSLHLPLPEQSFGHARFISHAARRPERNSLLQRQKVKV